MLRYRNDGLRRSPIVAVVGRSGSGKTTFLVRLIAELKTRGYRVAVIKHTSPEGGHHEQVGLGPPDKDTWHHFSAGADTVVLAAADRLSLAHRFAAAEPSPREIAGFLPGPVDLVLTEGYKHKGLSAIEIVRRQLSRELVSDPTCLIGLVTDLGPTEWVGQQPASTVPRFAPEDAAGVADLLERVLNLSPSRPDTR